MINLARMLNEREGSLLDDEQLLLTLQSSKTISQELSDFLQVSEATEIKLDETREVSLSFSYYSFFGIFELFELLF